MSDLRLAAQDPFHILYAQNHRWLQGWLLRRLGSHADAADLAQDTFVRTLKSQPATAIEEPRAFLCVVAKRVLCSFWRRHELEHAYLQAIAGMPEAVVPSEEEFALLREAVATVDAMLNDLPNNVRHAFLLNRLEGLTHQQIAEQLDVSLATVERWIKRAVTQCYLASLS